MLNANTKYLFSSIACSILILFSKSCSSLNLPKSTKGQVRTHTKFIRRALITTGKVKKSISTTNGEVSIRFKTHNGIMMDEGNIYNKPNIFESITMSNILLASLPVVVPVIAFNTFEGTSDMFQRVISSLSTGSDSMTCNMEEVSIVANGIVVTSIALLFATMASVTVSSLREVSIGSNLKV